MKISPTRRRKAPAKDRGKTAQITDPFDTSGIESAYAEKALIANLVPFFDGGGDPKEAREIIASVQPEMFSDGLAAATLAAFADAVLADPPTLADLSKGARRQAETSGWSPREVMAFIGDVGEKATSWRAAARLAKEAALEIRDAFARRQAVLACADMVARLQGGTSNAAELMDLSGRLIGIAEIAQQQSAAGRRLRVRKASEITPKPIEWFWPRRFTRGALTIITGMPGLSKSLLTIDVAARITRGSPWPDGAGSAPAGGVLMFGMEDDADRVVVPRLMAAGADLDLVRIVDGAETGRRQEEDAWLSAVSIDRDMSLVREQLDAFPECRAMVFDPLPQFVEAEENSNSKTRAALAPLVHLAQERGIAILAVCHLNKKSDLSMVQRIAGASSYGQMARHILFVGHDPDDTTTGQDKRRAMIVAKSSYGGQDTGQMYRVITRTGDQPALEWIDGTVEREADSLTPKPPGVSREYQERRGEAVDVLRESLSSGERPSAELEAELRERGFSRRQIDYAVGVLNVQKRQVRQADGRRAWMWGFPDSGAPTPQAHDPIPLDDWGKEW